MRPNETYKQGLQKLIESAYKTKLDYNNKRRTTTDPMELGQIDRAFEKITLDIALWEAEFEQHEVVQEFDDDKEITSLIKQLRSPTHNERYWAAENLGQYDGSRVIDALIKALRDESSRIRGSAASSLGKIGDASASDALLKLIWSEDDQDVIYIAINALGTVGNKEIIEKIQSHIYYSPDLVDALNKVIDQIVIWSLYKPASTFPRLTVTTKEENPQKNHQHPFDDDVEPEDIPF